MASRQHRSPVTVPGACEAAGATRVLLEMPSVARDKALKKLDEYALLLN